MSVDERRGPHPDARIRRYTDMNLISHTDARSTYEVRAFERVYR
ncbi:hypothetical protein [Lysobacter claricitrinus]